MYSEASTASTIKAARMPRCRLSSGGTSSSGSEFTTVVGDTDDLARLGSTSSMGGKNLRFGSGFVVLALCCVSGLARNGSADCALGFSFGFGAGAGAGFMAVSYTHLRAHET